MHHHAKGPRGGDPRKPFHLPAAGKRGGKSSTAQSPTSQDSAKSWRDWLPVHPAAELFPLMSEAELKELGEDIKQNGLREAPAITTSKKLLDGRNRLDAMEAAGIPFKFVFGPDCGWGMIGWGENNSARPLTIVPDSDAYAYVVSANIHRRHLTGEQKRDLIAALLKATPEKSNRQIAESVKADHKTVGSVRTGMEGRGEIPHVADRKDTKGRKQPSSKTRKTTKPPPATDKPKTGDDVQAIRDNAAKRRLEIEAEGLRSEIAEPKTERKPASEAARCEICREKKRAMQRSVFVCDRCVEIHELPEIRAEAAPSDDDLDIPEFLKRSAP